MEIYVVRHGESHVNTGIHLPREALDAGLTDKGRRQAQELADWLPGYAPDVDRIYTSTMKRARETAAYLEQAYSLQAVPDDRLREIGNNRMDAGPLPPDGLPVRYMRESPYQHPFLPVAPDIDSSETGVHFRARVGLFLDELLLRYEHDSVLIVGHGGTVNALADIIFNVGVYRRCDIRAENTSLSHFQYRGPTEWETWRIFSIGRMDHLGGLDQITPP